MSNKWDVVVSVSGGKDSTLSVFETLTMFPKEDVSLVWMDTGAEYLETEDQVKKVAQFFDLPLTILKSQRFDGFFNMVEDSGYFPTPKYRQCTLYLKKMVFEKFIRQRRKEASLGEEKLKDVVVVTGIRAEESQVRANKPILSVHSGLTTKDQRVLSYHPILNLKEQEVYSKIKAEGLPLHPCYEFSKRCSCWLCIFQHPDVVREYARLHPDLYEEACLLEEKTGKKWRQWGSKLIALQDLFK